MEVYCPYPGRQGSEEAGRYAKTKAAVERELPKYQRWLEEWRAKQ